jgi:hypothetical protein
MLDKSCINKKFTILNFLTYANYRKIFIQRANLIVEETGKSWAKNKDLKRRLISFFILKSIETKSDSSFPSE